MGEVLVLENEEVAEAVEVQAEVAPSYTMLDFWAAQAKVDVSEGVFLMLKIAVGSLSVALLGVPEPLDEGKKDELLAELVAVKAARLEAYHRLKGARFERDMIRSMMGLPRAEI